MGTKRSILTDEKGLPLSVVLSGANTLGRNAGQHHHFPSSRHTESLPGCWLYCSTQSVEKRQYTAHIRPRGEERKEIERNPDFKVRRWVVEVTHSFFNRFRKLLVRFEKKAQNYLALIHFACSIIVWRKLLQVHR